MVLVYYGIYIGKVNNYKGCYLIEVDADDMLFNSVPWFDRWLL